MAALTMTLLSSGLLAHPAVLLRPLCDSRRPWDSTMIAVSGNLALPQETVSALQELSSVEQHTPALRAHRARTLIALSPAR
jgi:hypothetical protein